MPTLSQSSLTMAYRAVLHLAIDHNNPKVRNGWGDVAFLLKYRLLSANEEHGSYVLTAFLAWSLPHWTILKWWSFRSGDYANHRHYLSSEP